MSSLKEKLAKHREKKGITDNKVTDIQQLLGIDESNISEMVNNAKSDGRFVTLPAEMFVADPLQPRKTFSQEGLNELQKDIESIGQIQPILVKPHKVDGKYTIVVGERRWRAIRASSKIHFLDAVILKDSVELDEILILRMQIQENNNREGVNALENAQSIMRGVSLCLTKNKSMNEAGAAHILGINRSSISKAKALVNASDEIKKLCIDNLVNDNDTLYEISKSYKENPVETSKFIDSIRNKEVGGNLRKLSKDFHSDLKKNNGKIKNNGSSKSEIKEISDISIDNNTLTLTVGNRKHQFYISDNVYKSFVKQE